MLNQLNQAQYCTFELGEMLLGIEVNRVQEVLRGLPVTQVPLAPEVVMGMMNLRGQIVPVISLSRRLDVRGRTEDGQATNVLVQTKGGTVSLLVDQVGDVIEVEPDNFEPPPQTLDAATRDLVRGAFKLPERLLLVLDIEKITDLRAAPAR